MKSLLENRIEEYENQVIITKNTIVDLETELKKAQKELRDVSKPRITEAIIEDIRTCIYDVIENVDFSDSQCYEVDFGIDYDNKVVLESISYNDTDSIQQELTEAIESLFVVE